jgi:hypothetical protein
MVVLFVVCGCVAETRKNVLFLRRKTFNLATHKRSGLQFLRTNCLASNQTRDSPEGGLCEKSEPGHGGAACCASSNMAFAIETNPSPSHLCDGLVKGAVEGFHIN